MVVWHLLYGGQEMRNALDDFMIPTNALAVIEQMIGNLGERDVLVAPLPAQPSDSVVHLHPFARLERLSCPEVSVRQPAS